METAPAPSSGSRIGRSGVGFTLVELLVVVAIITVLIAILLPVLGKAREQANRIKCAASLHSIGVGLMLYVQQYGYYPSSHQIESYSTEAAVLAASGAGGSRTEWSALCSP
jgi:prepilin-type N-terminal cleavage/methylation domain-containing protein